MPICIECRYPVSQLYHVLHSSNKSNKKSSASPSAHRGALVPFVTEGDAQKHTPSRNAAAGGADVRLTQCPRCKRFADKYVEHDLVILFIDLVLVKPQVCPTPHSSGMQALNLQVYRHLLFNRLGRDDDELDVRPPYIP